MKPFTLHQLRYLERVSWHDARQSVDPGLRRIARNVNRKLNLMLPAKHRTIDPLYKAKR